MQKKRNKTDIIINIIITIGFIFAWGFDHIITSFLEYRVIRFVIFMGFFYWLVYSIRDIWTIDLKRGKEKKEKLLKYS
jgi:type IV secretory pathway TrbL component